MVYRKESLIRRIEKLKEYNQDISVFGTISFQAYLSSKTNRYAIERLLFLIAENVLDFLDHILSARFRVVSDGYENVLENALKQNVLDETHYNKLKGLGGFRNVLAHEYLGLDDRAVYENYVRMKKILPEIIDYFEQII